MPPTRLCVFVFTLVGAVVNSDIKMNMISEAYNDIVDTTGKHNHRNIWNNLVNINEDQHRGYHKIVNSNQGKNIIGKHIWENYIDSDRNNEKRSKTNNSGYYSNGKNNKGNTNSVSISETLNNKVHIIHRRNVHLKHHNHNQQTHVNHNQQSQYKNQENNYGHNEQQHFNQQHSHDHNQQHKNEQNNHGHNEHHNQQHFNQQHSHDHNQQHKNEQNNHGHNQHHNQQQQPNQHHNHDGMSSAGSHSSNVTPDSIANTTAHPHINFKPIDDFVITTPVRECPEGQKRDLRGRCRPIL